MTFDSNSLTLEDVVTQGNPKTVDYDVMAFIIHTDAGYSGYEYLGKVKNVYDFYSQNEIEIVDNLQRLVYLKEIVED